LKATVEVEPSGQKSLKEVESRRSQLIDLMIGVLSAKNLSEMTKAEGRDQIKQELLERFNAELGEEKKIVRIYFAEFVVQ
jgi:flagellar basal body-associated protein FliL